MDACAGCLLIIVTLFLPPIGVFFVAGFSLDLLINVVLTLFGYLPGHIHAFYVEYVYFDRRAMGPARRLAARKPPLIFSKRVLNGGDKSARCSCAQPASCHGACASNARAQADIEPQTVGTVETT